MSTPRTTVRYGIIGFGSFAERAIAPAIRASANSELVAIQKRSRSAAREKASSHSIPLAFDSVDELVKHPDVDAVFIVSANSAHYKETLAAARVGKHVLVEKPMAMNVREVEDVIEACSRTKVKLMVGHMLRFSPLVRRMQEMIRSGGIGRISLARAEYIYDARLSRRSWLTDRTIAGGGPIYDVGIHCLDTLRFVLDDEVISVKSHLNPGPTGTTTEKTASLSLEFSRGTVASILCSFEAPMRRSHIEIVGTEGILSAPDFTLGDRTLMLEKSMRTDGTTVDLHREEIDVPNLYVEEVTSFSSSILSDTDVAVPGSVGLMNQRVLEIALTGGGVISHS